MTEMIITTFATLFVVIDPIALAPLFISLTDGMTQAQKRVVAFRSIMLSMCMLAAFALAGETLLGAIGISMAAFRISGGILLFLISIEMLFSKRTTRRKNDAGVKDPTPSEHNAPEEEDVEISDPSVFPLAIPLIAGPGSIATVILLIGQHSGNPTAQWMVFGVLVIVLLTSFVTFLGAGYLARVFGDTVINVITRLLGMLLAALSVQFVLDGMRAYGFLAG